MYKGIKLGSNIKWHAYILTSNTRVGAAAAPVADEARGP